MSNHAPSSVVRDAVSHALAEDLGILGDITSQAAIDEGAASVGQFVARDSGVVAGLACVAETYAQLDPDVTVERRANDGDAIGPGQVLAVVAGPTRSLLAGERVALNLVCHLSGVATLTRSYVNAATGSTRILDTRKTLPGLRALQKAAVRAGGGHNHRDSLSDAVLFKDNHLAVVGIARAVRRARELWPGRMVEVECESLAQVADAVAARVDRIMLDNMTPDEAKVAVQQIGGEIPVEVSGRIAVDEVAAYCAAGVDFISVGALTHSVQVFDIGLDFVESED